ncbi:outer membrane transport energization protein [Leptolyngbya sp. Heron Island J]|uniref:MotA/TolQ/ExbB proton channel family protein n=1 Tax=Leptolyngbya sp. Heron Island J TaxID=1385935 RepID=UPI0003B942FE|nr:MotA/TolQ/ExbB proton channel family protein [Leptolyngbya sp. Heron Island J]ESA32831.1 outer membrane transport energization protein [Leptolyngbya sp. Heron Island J]
MGISKLFTAGGVVIWPLLAASVLVVTLILERSWFWWQIYRYQERVVNTFLADYAQQPKAAIQELKQQPSLPIVRIFLAALSLEQATPDEFKLALESAAQAEIPLLKRFGTVFETVVGVAPLLGLLGTILGLIRALSSLQIGDVGTARASGVTAGIGEALVSTAIGLVVAMVTLLFANVFQGLYRRQRAAIADYGGQIEIAYRRYYRQFINRQTR